MKAVIQSGGKGTRLRPYTMVLPKPLMPVGSRPVLELLLKWLRRHGTRHAYITTGHLGHLIRSYCGDGRQWDLQISYTQEPEPLGTVGALGLLRDKLDSTFLMLNGDVITDLNLNAFIAAHRQHGGMLTIATARRAVQIQFGILESKGGWVTGFREKPSLTHIVSMGIYCFDAKTLDGLQHETYCDFPDLIKRLLAAGERVASYPFDGYWLDMGRPDDYATAIDEFESRRAEFLPSEVAR